MMIKRRYSIIPIGEDEAELILMRRMRVKVGGLKRNMRKSYRE